MCFLCLCIYNIYIHTHTHTHTHSTCIIQHYILTQIYVHICTKTGSQCTECIHGLAVDISMVLYKQFAVLFYWQSPTKWSKDKVTILPDLPLNTQLILQLVQVTDPNNKYNLLQHGV